MEIKSWFVWQLYMCLSSMASEGSNLKASVWQFFFLSVYDSCVKSWLKKKNNIYVLLLGGFGFQRRSKWLPIESQLSPTLADIAWCRGDPFKSTCLSPLRHRTSYFGTKTWSMLYADVEALCNRPYFNWVCIPPEQRTVYLAGGHRHDSSTNNWDWAKNRGVSRASVRCP